MGLLQVWQGKLHVPGMFRAHAVADMLAGSGNIGRMLTGSEVSYPPMPCTVACQKFCTFLPFCFSVTVALHTAIHSPAHALHGSMSNSTLVYHSVLALRQHCMTQSVSSDPVWYIPNRFLPGIWIMLDMKSAYLIPTWLLQEQRLAQVKSNQSIDEGLICCRWK